MQNPARQDFRWDLSFLFESDDEATAEGERIRVKARELKRFAGKLRDQTVLKRALDEFASTLERLERVSHYSILRFMENGRDGRADALNKASDALSDEVFAAISFIRRETGRLPASFIAKLGGDPRFSDYDMFLRGQLRWRDHLLSDREETLLDSFETPIGGNAAVFERLMNGGLEFPVITLSNGKRIALRPDTYYRVLGSPERQDSERAFLAYQKVLTRYRDVFAELLYRHMHGQVALAKARKFDSVLEASLFRENVPLRFYDSMLEEIEAHAGLYYRQLERTRRKLGIRQLREFDLNAVPKGHVVKRLAYTDACRLIRQSLEPLGREYANKAREILAPGSGWVDAFPRPGKHADTWMCFEAYGRNKRILVNFGGSWDDMFGLAHELGHAMNSLYASSRPFINAHEPRIIAETAATVHEYLLSGYLRKATGNRGARALRVEARNHSQPFRHAMRFRLERALYAAVENGRPLTANAICEEFRKANEWLYAGTSVFKTHPLGSNAWADDPFMYNPFYRRNYLTGHLAGMELAERIASETGFAKTYIETFLSAGGSRYPLQTLSDVGIAVDERHPYENAFRRIRETQDLLDECEMTENQV